jgi:hypothetical protein
MNDPRDEFGPYWLQTVTPFGASQRPGSPAKMPWEYPLPHQALASMWDPSNMPIPPARAPIFPPFPTSYPPIGRAPAWMDSSEPPEESRGILGQLSRRPVEQPPSDPWRQYLDPAKWRPSALPIPPALPPFFPPSPSNSGPYQEAPSWLQVASPFGSSLGPATLSEQPVNQPPDYSQSQRSLTLAGPLPDRDYSPGLVPQIPGSASMPMPMRPTVSASGQWTAQQTTAPNFGPGAQATSLSGAQEVALAAVAGSRPSSQRGYPGDDVGGPQGLGLAEQVQQRQPTLSPQEIENICRLDPVQHAAEFANRWLPGVGRIDPMTGEVRTLEWVRQQAYDMQKQIEQIQRELRCAPI